MRAPWYASREHSLLDRLNQGVQQHERLFAKQAGAYGQAAPLTPRPYGSIAPSNEGA